MALRTDIYKVGDVVHWDEERVNKEVGFGPPAVIGPGPFVVKEVTLVTDRPGMPHTQLLTLEGHEHISFSGMWFKPIHFPIVDEHDWIVIYYDGNEQKAVVFDKRSERQLNMELEHFEPNDYTVNAIIKIHPDMLKDGQYTIRLGDPQFEPWKEILHLTKWPKS